MWGYEVTMYIQKKRLQRAKKEPKTYLVSPGDFLERGGCRNGSGVQERGGYRKWKGDAGCI